MRWHVLLALKASHLAVAERCVLGVTSESPQLEIDFETFFSTAEGSGIIRLEVGGRLVAAPLPSFRSRGRRDAQNCVGRPLAENRSVCQGRSYGVCMLRAQHARARRRGAHATVLNRCNPNNLRV